MVMFWKRNEHMQLSPFSILEQESAKLSKALWDTIMCKASASSLLFPNFRIKIFFFFFHFCNTTWRKSKQNSSSSHSILVGALVYLILENTSLKSLYLSPMSTISKYTGTIEISPMQEFTCVLLVHLMRGERSRKQALNSQYEICNA